MGKTALLGRVKPDCDPRRNLPHTDGANGVLRPIPSGKT